MEKPVILIIEDSPLELLGMREVLTKNDFQVVNFQVKSFAEVFRLSAVVIQEKPHLILMDVNLGLQSYDGIRLAITLMRLREPGEQTPLIVLHSSLSAAELLALQKQCGADGFLEKGDLTLLPAKLRQFLSRILPSQDLRG